MRIRIVIISVIIITAIILGGYIYLFFIPSIFMEPNIIEKNKMKNELMRIESIVLYDEQGKAHKLDMQKFGEFIPYIEYRGILITKGTKVKGTAELKDGKTKEIYLSLMYSVIYYESGSGSFEVDHKMSQKWHDFINDSIMKN